MYKTFVRMIVSMMVLSTFSGKAMDKLPCAKPCPELIKEMENARKIAEGRRKIAEIANDALLREKCIMCMQIFHEESDEIRISFQDSNSINSVESSLK